MAESVSEAIKALDAAREKLDQARESAITELEAALLDAIDNMVEQTVVGQPEVTNSKGPADLGTLKFNLAKSAEVAVSGVRGVIVDVDLEARSSKAELTATGKSFLQVGPALSPLLRGVSATLITAGYDLTPLKKGRLKAGPLALSDIEDGYRSEVIGRSLDQATEEFGKAKLRLAEAERAVATQRARDAWKNA